MAFASSFEAPSLPGFLGAVRELPAPAENASAIEVLHTRALDGAAPSYDRLVANSRERVRSDVSGRRELSAAMVARAGLSWKVSECPLYMGGGTAVPTHKALRRDDTAETLDVVRSTYTVIQNSEAFAPFDDIVSEGGAEYVGAGSFDGGRVVYAQAKLSYMGEVVEGDFLRGMVLLSTGHTGEMSFRATQTMVRVVCMNTLMMGRKGEQLFRVNHTKNAARRVALAGDGVKQLFANAVAEVELYRKLAARRMTVQQTREYVAELLPLPENIERKRAVANVTKLRGEVMELVDGGNGTGIPGVRGTLWGAFNAVTEHVDHVRARRGADSDGNLRLKSTWFGEGADLKSRALAEAIRVLRTG